MSKIDNYINSVYSDFDGKQEEIEMLKKEMKDHLFQSVEDLEAEGKSEEESMDIAIKRFGEVKQLKKDLVTIYGIQNKFSRGILILTLILLSLSILMNISRHVINVYAQKAQFNLTDQVLDRIVKSKWTF